MAKRYNYIQLPHDFEVFEPSMDDDGTYIDDQEETGREAKTSSIVAHGIGPGMRRASLPSRRSFGGQRIDNPRRSLVNFDNNCKHCARNGKVKLTYLGLSTNLAQRLAASTPALSAMGNQQLGQYQPDPIGTRRRIDSRPRGNDADSLAPMRVGLGWPGLGEGGTRSSSGASASSSSESLFRCTWIGSNPYSVLATPESEQGGDGSFLEEEEHCDEFGGPARPASKSFSYIPPSATSDLEPRRRSTVGNAVQPGHRATYGRTSFSRNEAIIEHVPKKYSKGFDEDGYDFFPPTPKVGTFNGTAPGAEKLENTTPKAHLYSMPNKEVFDNTTPKAPVFSNMILAPTQVPSVRGGSGSRSGSVSPRSGAVGGSQLEEVFDPSSQQCWDSLAYSLRELDL